MERSVLKMPAVALRGMTILPGMITHFDVSRSRSAKAVERSVAQDQKLFVVTQKDPETENPDKDGLFSIGTIVEVKQIIKMPHNILRILVEGAGRAELCGLEDGEYLEADVCEIPDIVEEGLPEEAMLRNLQDIFEGYTGYGPPDRKLSDCAEYDGTDIHSCPISLGRASAVSGDREF